MFFVDPVGSSANSLRDRPPVRAQRSHRSVEVHMSVTQRISPCLWFDGEAEEAARYYTGIFKNSKITLTTRYSEVGFDQHHRPAGSVLAVEFELDGQKFMALNGGPDFKFNEAISLQVSCE